jgi:hypothetical protein
MTRLAVPSIAHTGGAQFRKHAERYAKSEDEFFKVRAGRLARRERLSADAAASQDFSAAFAKLLELGVPEIRWQEGSKLLKDG